MLTPLQRHVALTVAGLPEAEGFALAGGAALILRGIVARTTRDLDFFGADGDAVERLVPVVEAAIRGEGLAVSTVRRAHGFARLEIASGDAVTELDLAADARLFPADVDTTVPMLSELELAVDKVLAVFGRAEARDFVDLAALVARHDMETLLGLAHKKDGGFDRALFVEMLHRFDRLRSEEFDLAPGGHARLRASVTQWARSLGGNDPLL